MSKLINKFERDELCDLTDRLASTGLNRSESCSNSSEDSGVSNETAAVAAATDGWCTVGQQTAKNRKSNKSTTITTSTTGSTGDLSLFNVAYCDEIRGLIERNVKTLVILRGASGSGKSILASQIKYTGVIVSADHFFTNKNGVYQFDPFKLTDAHQNCKNKAKEALMNGISPVIVDNTNIRVWEFKPYVIMALKHNYEVRVYEPNTPWKSNPKQLSSKNRHGVPLSTIKKTIEEFERVDMSKLIDECRKEVERSTSPKSSQRPGSRPGSFLPNFDDIINKNDWSIFPELNQIDQSTSSSNPLASNKENNTAFNLIPVSQTKPPDKHHQFEEDDIETRLQESQQMLEQMFPSVAPDIIFDFLLKYDNNVDMVTNILLDSVNLDDTPPVNDNVDLIEIPPVSSSTQTPSPSGSSITIKRSIKSLQELCWDVMNSWESNLEKQFKTQRNMELGVNTVSTSSSSYAISSVMSDDKESSKSDCESSVGSVINHTRDSGNGEDVEDEPVLELSVNKSFLSSLIELFGHKDDLKLLKDSNNLGVSLNLGYQIYTAWKRDVRDQTKTADELEQMVKDEQLSQELFNELNVRDPLDNTPIYLGTNATQTNLRQIMAEQMREQYSQRDKSKMGAYGVDSSLLGATSRPPDVPTNTKMKNVESLANMIKLKQMQEKYLNVVDSKTIEEILESKNYNTQEASEHINKFFNLENVKEPKSVFKWHSKARPKKTEGASSNNQQPDYYNAEESNMVYFDDLTGVYKENEHRILALKYSNLRQEYFEKASEAHSRGWGAVAQYYAQMGHTCSDTIKRSNNTASMQIFMANNYDIKNQNTLDLHGLHVKEAIQVLKNVISEKKEELKNTSPRKKKTYIFVITGNGNHSENGAKLRPSVINYLNHNKIIYKEVNVGLLQISLV